MPTSANLPRLAHINSNCVTGDINSDKQDKKATEGEAGSERQPTHPRMKKSSNPATPTGSQRKGKKRAAAKRKAAEDARSAAPSETRPEKVARKEEKNSDKRLLDEKVAPSPKGRSGLARSLDIQELVRRAVAHATAAAEYFPMTEEDDDDEDDDAGEVQPHTARDLREELSSVAEIPAVIEEAPIVTAKGFRSVLPQHLIPVIESTKLATSQAIATKEGGTARV